MTERASRWLSKGALEQFVLDSIVRLNPQFKHTWCAEGVDIDGQYAIKGIKMDAHLGTGIGLQVTPALQPKADNALAIWYDSAHFLGNENAREKYSLVTAWYFQTEHNDHAVNHRVMTLSEALFMMEQYQHLGKAVEVKISNLVTGQLAERFNKFPQRFAPLVKRKTG